VKEYGIVFVKEHDQCIWDSEYEVVESEDKPMVKVGDKVMIVSGGGSHVGYENGDVLEVIAFSARNQKDIYVRILKDVGYTGRAADRPICQPFAFLIEPEYEVVKEMPKAEIKSGDKVKLIDRFYEHDAFKADSRHIRKQIASLNGRELEVKDICKYTNRASTGKIDYSIPVELLEKVEPDSPVFEAGKSYVFDKTLLEWKPRPDSWESDIDGKSVEFIPGDTKGSVSFYLVDREWCRESKHRYTDEQIAEAEQIIGSIVASLPDWDTFFFRREGSETMIYASGNANKQNSAKCMETDEYNQTIGRMIALCRHVGRPLPKWL
jgi:hypothetical protein